MARAKTYAVIAGITVAAIAITVIAFATSANLQRNPAVDPVILSI